MVLFFFIGTKVICSSVLRPLRLQDSFHCSVTISSWTCILTISMLYLTVATNGIVLVMWYETGIHFLSEIIKVVALFIYFWDKVSHCSLGWPRTQVAQAGQPPTSSNLPDSAWALRLQAWWVTSSYQRTCISDHIGTISHSEQSRTSLALPQGELRSTSD